MIMEPVLTQQLRDFLDALLHALRNLTPILVVVVGFQALLLREWPEGGLSMAVGLLIVALGVALFLRGLELSIFPVGKRLANQFARRGSLPVLLTFGFAIGFSAVIAEPALIAVAEQAETISDGRIEALTLRLIVATSVGLVMALGVLRVILGHPLYRGPGLRPGRRDDLRGDGAPGHRPGHRPGQPYRRPQRTDRRLRADRLCLDLPYRDGNELCHPRRQDGGIAR